jgi:hypothetical protein
MWLVAVLSPESGQQKEMTVLYTRRVLDSLAKRQPLSRRMNYLISITLFLYISATSALHGLGFQTLALLALLFFRARTDEPVFCAWALPRACSRRCPLLIVQTPSAHDYAFPCLYPR